MLNFADIQTIFFAGIGGIGMSALARYFLCQGKVVRGYDRTLSAITAALEKEGAQITNQVELSLLTDCDLLIYSPALSKEDPYRVAAQQIGLLTLKRSQALGEISKNYKTIAVAGTHGKTSVTCLLTWLLYASKVPCTAFIGGISRNLDSNFVYHPESEILVVEADEFDRSFLTLNPSIAVITAVDPDHLDIFKDSQQFEEAFVRFASQITNGGYLFCSPSAPIHLFKHTHIQIETYGKDNFYANVLSWERLQIKLDFYARSGEKWLSEVIYSQPGVHNLENLSAALSVLYVLGVKPDFLREALLSYKGVKRRLEVVAASEKWVVIDDYAHHPTEIAATLKAVRKCFDDYRLVVAFQPHLYSRTRDFAEGFASALSLADKIFLLPVYAAREKEEQGETEKVIFQHLSKEQVDLVNLNTAAAEMVKELQPYTVLITMGAGDIDSIIPTLLGNLKFCFLQ
jgi:UDP-N-acetylmuramate--alanine ligase